MAFYNITVLRVPVNQGAPGTTQLVAASSGNKHKIVGVILTLDAAGTLKFIDGSGDLTGPMSLPASGGFMMPGVLTFPLVETGVNSALSVVTTGGKAAGVVLYVTEP